MEFGGSRIVRMVIIFYPIFNVNVQYRKPLILKHTCTKTRPSTIVIERISNSPLVNGMSANAYIGRLELVYYYYY